MRFPITRALAIAICAAALGGCATGRSEIALDNPRSAGSGTDSSAPAIAIRSVSDLRVFEQQPAQPSTPSLAFGGAEGATETAKLRAVGRKHTGRGQALGDVLLEPSTTVSSLIRLHFAAAAAEAGYRVVGPAEAEIVVDLTIDRFWSWTHTTGATIAITSLIEGDVIFTGRPRTETVSVRSDEKYNVITEGVWSDNIEQALAQYRDEVTRVLAEKQP